MEIWNEGKIKDFVDVKGGKRLPKGKRLAGFPTAHPYIRIRDIGKSKVLQLTADYEYVDDETQKDISRYIVSEGDILISVVGTIGLVGIVGDTLHGANQTENCDKLTNYKGIDRDFLYYYLVSPIGQGEISKGTVGAVQPKLPLKNIQDLTVRFPSLRTQKKIASVLSALDNKIEKNTEINENLQEQMEALYKSWFKDFAPFNGECPTNWKKADIYSIANIIYGAPFSSKLFNTDGDGLPIIRIRDLREQAFVTYTTEQHPKGHLIQPGDIVVGMDGEFRPYIWGNTEAWLNQRVCIFENKRPKGKAFVLYTIKPLLYQIEQTQVATTVIHIGKKDYDAFEFYLPDDDTLDQFDEITCPMIDQIVVNCLENKRLAEIRDAILPKLMSGELDVSDIDL